MISSQSRKLLYWSPRSPGVVGHGDLLGQAGAQAVGAGDDDAVVHAQFQEGVADGAHLGQEVLVRHGDLAVLVAALLLVGDLVFDLDGAGARLDHLLGQQIGRFGVAEAGVDVGDDRHDVGDVVVDFFLDGGLAQRPSGGVELAEQAAQFTGVGLAQEGVELPDQRRHRGLLVHRLVGQRAELGAQRGDHPAGQVKVAALGGAEVLLDRDHLLLGDEAVPAAQRLGVLGRVGVVGGHVGAHDVGGVPGDLQAGLEPVLSTHACGGLGIDGIPRAALFFLQTSNCLDVVLILGSCVSPKSKARLKNSRVCR